jgi:SAM-dependent methyltransferase
LLEQAKARGFECYGIERNPTAAERLEEIFGKGHTWTGMFEDAEFPALPKVGAFNVITMCDFIEHVRDPIAVLQKAGSLLAPGGTLIISTPDGGSPSRKLMGNRWLQYKEEHLNYFSRESMKLALGQAGLKLDHIIPATKYLSLSYLQTQFSAYSPKPAGTLLKCIRPFITKSAWHAPRPFSFGELCAVASKPGGVGGNSVA